MTRAKDYALITLAVILSLSALGLFASVGLAVLGVLVLAGLIAGTGTWIATVLGPKPTATEPCP